MSESKEITIEKVLEIIGTNKKEPSLKSFVRFFRIYIFPLSAITLFFVIIFGLVVPKISNIFSEIAAVNQLSDELTEKRVELIAVQSLNANATNLMQTLQIIDSLAPAEQTEVVNFQTNIANLAQQNNLIINNQLGSDSIAGVIENSIIANNLLFLREVPNILEITGTASDIFNFIEDLSELEDFIVVDEMDLIAGTNGEWTMNINVIKYQFAEKSDTDSLYETYLQVPISAKINEKIGEYLEERE